MNKKATTGRKLENILKTLFITLVCITLFSCSVKYPIISVNKLNDLKMLNSLPHEQYIVLQNEIDSPELAAKDEVLTTLYYIKSQELYKAKSYVKSLNNTDEETVQFCKGVLSFFDKNYALAYQELKVSETAEYPYLKHLLIGDCMLELNAKSSAPKFKTKEILFQFQKSMDSCPNSEIKDVIKIHVKFAKYGG